MNQSTNEGPTLLVIEEMHCKGCKYLNEIKLHQGDAHNYRCKHPIESKDHPRSGKYIGMSTNTPNWCPYLRVIDNQTEGE